MSAFDKVLLTSEGADEIEALFAIYEGDIKNLDLDHMPTQNYPRDSIGRDVQHSVYILMQFRPRTADAPETSFVTADIIFGLPQGYPNSHPSICITRTSGFGDDGRGLKLAIGDHLAMAPLGEPMLMNLFELIFDYLDEKNEGECLICNDTLFPISQRASRKCIKSIRSNCYHCFHVSCLCRWGAICHKSSLELNDASDKTIRELSRLKSLESDVRAKEDSRFEIENDILRMESELGSHKEVMVMLLAPKSNASDAIAPSRASEGNAGNSKQDKGKGKVAASQSAPLTNKKSNNKTGSSSKPITQASSVEGDGTEVDENELRKTRLLIEQLEKAISDAKLKIKKLNSQIKIDVEVLEQEMRHASDSKARKEQFPHDVGVKCPYCTAVISESSHPHIAILLRNGFDHELEILMNDNVAPLTSDVTGEVAIASSTPEASSFNKNVKSIGLKDATEEDKSVLLLPSHLVEMVRATQRKQQQLKSNLKCTSSSGLI